MPGISLLVGGVAFIIGLVLIGLSGSAKFACTWVGPVGTLLLAAGLGLELVSLTQA